MGKTRFSSTEYVEISNKVLGLMVAELRDEDEMVNPIDMVIVLSAMHRAIFANIEREEGIEKAREDTGFLIDLMKTTMKEGAKDELEQEDL